MNKLFDSFYLWLLKKRVQKHLPDSLQVTNVERTEDTLGIDKASVTPLDGFKHEKRDCPCAPRIVPSVRGDGTEFYIEWHNEMEVPGSW